MMLTSSHIAHTKSEGSVTAWADQHQSGSVLIQGPWLVCNVEQDASPCCFVKLRVMSFCDFALM